MNNEIQNRTQYIDYLRVFSIFAVVVLHVAAMKWYSTDVNSFSWQVFNFFDSIVRWSVPVFVMISGVLFLNKDIPVKKLYSKYIVRMIFAFLLWSVIYVMFNKPPMHDISLLIARILKGHYHMWFIIMIIGIYMCVPLFKSISKEKNIMKYYLLLAVIFVSFVPTVILLFDDFFPYAFVKNITSTISKSVINNMHMDVVLGFGGCFVLGYYLSKTDIPQKYRKYIYLLGLLGFVSTVLLDANCAIETQKACSRYYGYNSFNVLLESIAVFVWFKYRNYKNSKFYQFIVNLSKWSFGVYLVHVLILEQVVRNVFHLTTLSFNPLLSVLSISLIVYVFSFVVSWVLHQIPIIKKYMV